MAEGETWKPVPGYEGLYEVSDQGRVRGLRREGSRPVERQIISSYEAGGSNRMLKLSKGGQESTASVARLVLLAHGPDPETATMRAERIDPDGSICLENLEWKRPITRSKLSEDQAATIYKWAWETSLTNKKVGRHFGVTPGTVSNIKHGRTWGHVTAEITVDKS